jgi:hypothetical protein
MLPLALAFRGEKGYQRLRRLCNFGFPKGLSGLYGLKENRRYSGRG